MTKNTQKKGLKLQTKAEKFLGKGLLVSAPPEEVWSERMHKAFKDSYKEGKKAKRDHGNVVW